MKKVWKWFIVGILLSATGVLGFIAYQNFIKPLPLPKSSTSADKLVEYHQIGGFAGFRDHLVIYKDGSAAVLDEFTNNQKDFQIKSEELAQLMDMVSQFNRFSYNNEGSFKGPDSLYRKLIFYGQGPNQPEQEQKDTIIRLINSILIQSKL